MQSAAQVPMLPSQVGPYRILKAIGQGGMGAVYLAEQDHPNREVALKVIRADSYSAKLLRRFEHEAEMLGRLQHPGIAQIFEAGTHATPQGLQPYFAMEYVRGEPLDDYAKSRELGTRARLELAAKVCDAIEHAHQKGVIHRDLKPGNILVTEDGQPKVLDFGVARVTDADVRSTTLHTDLGVLVGTLAYMSPEQASGDPGQLDSRSDVYALGVVIFELLTGELPYRVDRSMVPESVRAIREEEPSRLSTHDRTLRGDVETIVAKALEKDKARRYPSASALAADIRCYLADEPISARPPSAGYQLSKFARRNKVLVGGIAAFVLALVAGAIVATDQALRARRAEKDAKKQTALVTTGLERATKAEKEALAQRDRANEAEKLALDRLERAQIEQAKAAQSARFLESLFGSIDPYEAEGADTTLVRRLLTQGAGRISSELAGQPEVEASIRSTLGGAYKNLGLYAEAALHLRKAEELQLELFGEEDRRTLRSRSAIAELHFAQGDYARAEELELATAENLERLFGADDPDTLRRKVGLGTALTRAGKLPEAEAMLRAALELGRTRLGAEDPVTVDVSFALARTLVRQHKFGEAETLFGEVAAAREESLGPDHPSTLDAEANLSVAIRSQGRFEESEDLERELLASFSRTFGREHPRTLAVQHNVAWTLSEQGEVAEAEELFHDCLEIRRRVLGPKHPDTLNSLSVLAFLLSSQERFDEAEPLLQEALAGQREVLGEDHPDTLLSKFRLAVLLKEKFRYVEAAELLAEIADNKRRTSGDDEPALGLALYNLAGTWQDAGEDERAEPLLREVLALREKHGWSDMPFLASTMQALGNTLQERGEIGEADALFEDALRMRRRFGKKDVSYSLRDYGECLLERGEFARAEPLLRELCEVEPQVRPPDSWWIPSAKVLYGRSLAGQSRFVEAEPLLRPACESLLENPAAKPSFVARSVTWVAEMYEEWATVEPDAGHDEQAAQWRSRAEAPAR